MLQVKICDLGLATYTSSTITATQSTSAVGSALTRAYISPERLLKGKRSKEDDCYAFGILLYFIATSRSPYDRNISSAGVEELVRIRERPDFEAWKNGEDFSPEQMERVVGPFCELARQCWLEVPAQRPTFGDIHDR